MLLSCPCLCLQTAGLPLAVCSACRNACHLLYVAPAGVPTICCLWCLQGCLSLAVCGACRSAGRLLPPVPAGMPVTFWMWCLQECQDVGSTSRGFSRAHDVHSGVLVPQPGPPPAHAQPPVCAHRQVGAPAAASSAELFGTVLGCQLLLCWLWWGLACCRFCWAEAACLQQVQRCSVLEAGCFCQHMQLL